MNENLAKKTILVTVTYGDRMLFLSELLRRALDVEKVESAIVVSNASCANLSSLEALWPNKVRIIYVENNSGSANGYAIGIEAALESDKNYIWLMDDDNAPVKGALEKLHKELSLIKSNDECDLTAVLGFRPEHQPDISAGLSMKKYGPRHSSFFGFCYKQIFIKIHRRFFSNINYGSSGKNSRVKLDEIVRMPYAPYGGLLAGRALFERIGLPRRDFVLYADDTEYTYRITALGGSISLVTGAELEDLEGSWNIKGKFSNSFMQWLLGGTDLRAFYSARNQAWFDKNIWIKSRFDFYLNKYLFLLLLAGFSIYTGRYRRLRLLLRAIYNGERGVLGVDSDFILQ